MRLLLDTQAVYLWVLDDPRLPGGVAAVLDDERNQIAVSAASFWEISIKHSKGKLDWPPDGFEQLLDSRFVKLGITPQHAVAAGQLPFHHGDPFDRVLIAQARAEAMTLVGGDPVFRRYDVDVFWG